MIDLIVTDLDGTLWGADERIHDRTLDALHQLAARPVPVLVATGRRLSGALGPLARSGLALPTVALDGCLGHDVRTGRTFHRAQFDPGVARAVLDGFVAAGLSPCVYVSPEDGSGPEVLLSANPSTHPRHVEILGGRAARADLHRATAEEPVLMFAIVGGDHDRLQAVAGTLGPSVAFAVTRDVMLGGSTLTVRPAGISKWAGVLAWCDVQGLDPSRVLAVGDAQNDLELLGAARVACVVQDGCDEALALAHHVIGPACDGGWADILNLLDAGVSPGAAADGRWASR
jgi:5-amino-6-(5-phospho-D-ribitylamino)uracil phosphatase